MYDPTYDTEGRCLFFASEQAAEWDWDARGLKAFFCGALQDPNKMSGLIGRHPTFAPAALYGYKQIDEPHDGRQVPFMVEEDGPRKAVFTGVVYLDLSPAELEQIEGLELAGDLRRRACVEVAVGDRSFEAVTYLKR